MGWNEPDKDQDSWGGKNQPPDLDEALKRLQNKLKKTLMRGSDPSSSDPTPGSSGAGFLALIAFSVLFLLWAIAGIFIVNPAEQAVIMRFGKYIETVGPGPHWIPRIISSKIIQNVERISIYTYTAQMLTKDENLVSIEVAVKYHIGNLENYLFNVANVEGSIKQATSSALRQVVGTTTLDQLITEGRESWESKVQDLLIKILDTYKTGITIVSVSPQEARAPESVQDVFDDAIKAQEDEKRYREQAEAYKARVVPIAEGNAQRISAEAKAYAEKVVLKASGEVAEFLAILPEYLQAPYITAERMYIDTMQKIFSKTSKVVVNEKSGNILYLPIDKLTMTQQTVLPSLKLKEESKTTLLDSRESSVLYDGRDTTRPTEHLGRGSNESN